MSLTYLVPQWFFGFDIALELIFAFVALIVSYYAFKIYQLSGNEESKLLTASFLFIGLSYLTKAMLNILVIGEIKETVRQATVQNLHLLGMLANYSYLFLFTTGLVTFSYMTFKIRSIRTFTLLLATNLLTIFFSMDKTITFSLMTSLLTIYICAHYFLEYTESKKLNNLLLLIAFLFLFFSGVSFVFAENYYINYVIGHLLELASYLLILATLLLTIRKR